MILWGWMGKSNSSSIMLGGLAILAHHPLSHPVPWEVAMTQVGHTLMGTALGILSLPAHRSPRWKVGYFAIFALLANLPDLPLPYWGHGRYDISHSLFVNLLLSVLAVALCSWQPGVHQLMGGRAVLVAGTLAWLSHLLLDAFYDHRTRRGNLLALLTGQVRATGSLVLGGTVHSTNYLRTFAGISSGVRQLRSICHSGLSASSQSHVSKAGLGNG